MFEMFKGGVFEVVVYRAKGKHFTRGRYYPNGRNNGKPTQVAGEVIFTAQSPTLRGAVLEAQLKAEDRGIRVEGLS